MARQRNRDLETILRGIEQAGNIDSFVNNELRERGFLVERRETDGMSARELARYKKELKAEAAERRELRKEAWSAYKTKNVVHLGEGIYWNDADDYDKWDLENAESRAAENELPALDSPQQLADALAVPLPMLRWLTYHRDVAEFVHYERFSIPKRDGSERPIWAPRPKLKQCQRWVLRNVLERLPMHGAAHGFMPARSIRSNSQPHGDSQMIVKMDLKEFFPTITQPRVKGVFRKAGYREQIATLVSLLCTESPRKVVEEDGKTLFVSLGPRCLPQGAPTSPALTNVICLNLDRRLSGLAASLGWRYTRYADDMTFSLPSGKKKAKDTSPSTIIGAVNEITRTEGFQVHCKKTRVLRTGTRQTVTGLVVNAQEGPRVSRKVCRMLRAAIHNLSQGKELHDGETLATLHGYISFIASCDPAKAEKFRSQLQEATNSS